MSKRAVIWLSSMPRSGSNWVSQILASHSDIRLKFCPLFSYEFKNACGINSTGDDWQKLFEAVYEREGAYLDQHYLRDEGLLPSFKNKADAPSLLCIKSTRYHDLTRSIVEKCDNVKFVALVRNPVATIHSWIQNPKEFPATADPMQEWRTGACRKFEDGNPITGEFWGFDDWKQITTEQIQLAEEYPDRVRILRYEDLVEQGQPVLEDLFDWLGLSLTEATLEFFKSSQSKTIDNVRAVYKKPEDVVRWKTEAVGDIRFTIGSELVGRRLSGFVDHETLALGAAWKPGQIIGDTERLPLADSGTKSSLSELAVFGGSPLFPKNQPRPKGQLAVPDWVRFEACIDAAFEAKRFTNDGPNTRALAEALASYHQVKHVVMYSNACVALIAAMQVLYEQSVADDPALKSRRLNVLFPGFTYVGLPHLIRWAGFEPVYCDVDPVRHTIDPSAAKALIDEDTLAIMGVHQVNAPCDCEELAKLSEATGVPVFYDAVHALGCKMPNGMPSGGRGEMEIFSLHATKMLNGTEGGYITTNNDRLVAYLSEFRNFGYVEASRISCIGLNGKLNELHSAMALASLDTLDDVSKGNKARFEAYEAALANVPGINLIPYADHYSQHNYEFAVILLDSEVWPLSREETVFLLRAENALAVPYYNEVLYRLSDYPPSSPSDKPNTPRGLQVPESLTVTDRLARSMIQLPVGDLVSVNDCQIIGEWFESVSTLGNAIRQGLGQLEGSA
ncbi:aminotransferase class I/II-fold pyridoxal phosphate-dependent enzyme [Thalassospira sp.]|uniref:aminotransferase class I/II-fold pyridoxal phosphate-dependent enzyme n=1 Tax=Thalassospira sp. TaxID=1912094 RepID=UPI000C3B5EA3|nr:aminotransferase class I/II-fold pyridoxal phosphate-dependent enzyme [Thalassospira sp.]MBC08117.1 hypothetical protein [Thalassospira sp.]